MIKEGKQSPEEIQREINKIKEKLSILELKKIKRFYKKNKKICVDILFKKNKNAIHDFPLSMYEYLNN